MADYYMGYTQAQFEEILAKGDSVAKTPLLEVTASRNLLATDINKILKCTNSGDIDLTVQLNASEAIDLYSELVIFRYGAGNITVALEGGVTLRSAGSAVDLGDQYTMATLKKIGTDEWVLVGSIA